MFLLVVNDEVLMKYCLKKSGLKPWLSARKFMYLFIYCTGLLCLADKTDDVLPLYGTSPCRSTVDVLHGKIGHSKHILNRFTLHTYHQGQLIDLDSYFILCLMICVMCLDCATDTVILFTNMRICTSIFSMESLSTVTVL